MRKDFRLFALHQDREYRPSAHRHAVPPFYQTLLDLCFKCIMARSIMMS